MPAVIFVLLLVSLQPIASLWKISLEFWSGRLDLPGRVLTAERWFGAWHVYSLPYVELPSRAPSAFDLMVNAVLVLVSMLVSYIVLRRALPFAYIVWTFGAIHMASVVYFFFWPDRFPYSIAGHVRDGLEMNITLLLVLPWILAPTYFPLDFAVWKKIVTTVLMISHVIVFAPLQYMVHAKLIFDMSLIAMPVLFIMCGLFLNVFCFIAIYGWAMSWKRQQIE
jgi:hypothetical protein